MREIIEVKSKIVEIRNTKVRRQFKLLYGKEKSVNLHFSTK